MPLTLLTPPGAEPVSLGQAKAWLRVSHADEDELISDLIRASRERVESFTGRALITRQYRESLDDWPAARGFRLRDGVRAEGSAADQR